MGVPSRSTQEYRDDPDAVSLHTTPDDYTYDDAPEISGLPPSYADSEGASTAAQVPSSPFHVPGELGADSGNWHYLRESWKRMDHDNSYSLTGGKPKVFSTQEMMDARCDADPEYLQQRVERYAEVAPNPLVYIIGTHKKTTRKDNKKETKEVTDFRIVMNLREYLTEETRCLSTVTNGEKTFRGSFMKKRAPGIKQDIEVGSESPNLKEWCHRYCASHSKLRIFRIRHEVIGLDEAYLRNRLEGIIRGTNYAGKITIEFPVEDQNIDFYTSTRINEWRLKTWVCWIFYLTFLWIFTWPYLFFATKRYAVCKSQWFFSSVDGDGFKKYASVSEEQWVERWHVGIRRLALDRFQGEASYAHLQGVINRPADPPMPGRVQTGHVGVDNAVGFLQQGLRVASVLTRGGDPMAGLQNGWGYDN